MMSFVVPEFHLLKDVDEQIVACKKCWKANQRKMSFGMIVMNLPTFLALFIWWRLSLFLVVSDVIMPGAIFVWSFPAVLGSLWLCRRSLRRSAREHLNASGMRLCMDCGYNLAGNVSGVCPECGERIQQAD
jgi:hypothetical protein